MADKKISALTASSTPLAGTEILPIVQSGSTVKVSVDNLTAGRTVSAASLDVVSSGNPTITLRGTDGAYSSIFNIQAAGGGISLINATGGSNILSLYTNTVERFRVGSTGDATMVNGNLVIGTAGKGVTTSVANGDVTVTPLGTGKTILAKNGLRIPNNAAITVGTGATQISVNAVSWSSLAFVFGVDGGGNAFSDLVFYADGTTVALASRTVSGVPVTRTYTAPAGQLNLAMLSGSYSVFFQHIWTA